VIFTHNEIDGDHVSRDAVWMHNHQGFPKRKSSVSNAVFAHNRFLHADTPGIWSAIRTESILVTDNIMTLAQFAVWLDDTGTWDIRGDQYAQIMVGPPNVKYGMIHIKESVPQRPTLVAIPTLVPNQVELRWDGYPDRNDNVLGAYHDSFYIVDVFDGQERRVAYRPPNDSRWTFQSDNNDFVPFDTLGYVVSDLESGTHFFGIRAQNGSKNSGWSIVQFDVP
jgi:hypothetical protein